MRGHNSNSLISGLALVMLLLLVVTLPGCGGDGDGDGNGGGWAEAMMNRVPRGAAKFMFTFTDFAAMRADVELREFYDDYKKEIEPECEALGISPDNVDSASKGYSGWIFLVLDGEFDLDGVRQGLEDKGYQDGEYKEVQTWGNSSADIGAIALVSANCIVIGDDVDNLQKSIDVVKGDEDSLSDDEDMLDLMGRLPPGIVVSVSTYYKTYPGCETTGYSLNKKDSDTVLVTMILLFEDEDSADDAMKDIEGEHDNGEVTKDGRYITVNSESDLK